MDKCVAKFSFNIENYSTINPILIVIEINDILEFERTKTKYNKRKKIWISVRENQIGNVSYKIYLNNNKIEEISEEEFKNKYDILSYLREQKINKILETK